MERCDVLVIGGGIAGAAAALSAAAAGARTVLLRAGPGATALCAGAWIGAPPDGLALALEAAGLPLDLRGAALPHPDGRLVASTAAPSSHVRAAIDSAPPVTLVCGIAGLAGFRPRSLATLWADAAGAPADALIPAEVELAGTPAAGWSPVSLAAALDRDPALLGEPLARATRGHGAVRAIVPAVLGLHDHARTAAAIAEAGVEAGEALGSRPSIPGWRLDRALLRALEDAGVRVLHGRVTDRLVRDGRVERVDAALANGDRAQLPCAGLVLATGRFIGGGVSTQPQFTDTVLGIPLFVERAARTFTEPNESLALTDPVRLEPQPLLAVGLRTGDDGLVLDAGNLLVNAYAAGSIRAGAETAVLGLGQAADEGWAAGAAAAATAAAA
jgi:anaerobic glycerol-3-phosphate dehydrogenase